MTRNMISRRNFLVGMGAAGALILMPPALTLSQIKKQPEFFCGTLRGVADGPVVMTSLPEPHSMSVNNFIFRAETHTEDITSLCDTYRTRIPTFMDYSIETWFRSERENLFSYLGERVHISARVAKDKFYSGNFLITDVELDLNG